MYVQAHHLTICSESLRSALNCCGAHRLIATRGFLRLICQHLQDSPLPPQFPAFDPSAASCSQASLSQHASLSSSKDVNLLQVICCCLRCMD